MAPPTDLASLFREVYNHEALEPSPEMRAFGAGYVHGAEAMLAVMERYLPLVDRDVYGLPSATTLLLQNIYEDMKRKRMGAP